MTDCLFVFDGRGGIRRLVGDTSDYRDLIEEEAAAQPAADKPERRNSERSPGKEALPFKARKECESLPAQIDVLENEPKEPEAVFQQATPDPTGMDRRYREMRGRIEAKITRWEDPAGRA